MDLVVNEWLPEYFRPDASVEEKQLLKTFLTKFESSNDRIIVRRPSPFLNKFYRYASEFQNLDEVVTPIREFLTTKILNIERCIFIDTDEKKPLPESLIEKLSLGNYNSDQYLFEAASCVEGERMVVTTDAKLKTHLQEEDWCKVVLLSDFLKTY